MIADGDRVCDHCHWTYGDISVALIVQLEVVEQREFNGPGKAEHLREGESFMVFLCKFPRTFAYAQNSMDPPLHLTTFIKKLAAAQSDRGNG